MARHKESERDKVLSESRQRLLQAAAEVFASEGYAGANINRISTSAGFAKGTIYNYFESKRALMLALIEETAQAHLAYVAEPVRQEKDAGRRLERFFEAGFDFVGDFLPQATVMVNNLFGPHPEFKQVMHQAYLPMFELVSQDIIALGMGQGIFRTVVPASMAGLLMNVYLGTASQVDDDGKSWHEPGQVADFVLRALRN